MKITRRQLRKLVMESIVSEQQAGRKPDRFDDEMTSDMVRFQKEHKERISAELQQTVNWFEDFIFSREFTAPVTVEKSYMFDPSGPEYIDSDQQVHTMSPNSKVTVYVLDPEQPLARKYREMSIRDIYNTLEKAVSDGDYNVSMTSNPGYGFEDLK